jgi:hypothetical protein
MLCIFLFLVLALGEDLVSFFLFLIIIIACCCYYCFEKINLKIQNHPLLLFRALRFFVIAFSPFLIAFFHAHLLIRLLILAFIANLFVSHVLRFIKDALYRFNEIYLRLLN